MDVTPNGLEYKESEMSYLDFLITKEHAFIRNIFDKEELQKSRYLKSLEDYHKAMCLYIKLVKLAEIELKNVDCYGAIFDEDLQNFLQDECPAYEYDIPGLVQEIKSVEVRNFKSKTPKFVIQLYAFFYQCLIDFPTCKFDKLKTITTRNMFEKFCRVIKSKVHLHHSHTTGEILGNIHDFCNWKLRENKETISLIGHNFLGFDIFYMVKGYRSSCWGTKDFNLGGTNLTNVNFANITDQIKIIDTLKYYQTTLANLASTADKFEKSNIKKNIQQFIENHNYFKQVWKTLKQEASDKILDLIAEGKGVMPYEKVLNAKSFLSKPDQDFYSHTEFNSSLKQSNVSVAEYENAKYLYQTLKMRNLGDMNNLYNAQDVILLCEIIENRFQQMQEKFGYNPRKCNSASTLNGCVQRNLSKVIIALPTKTEHAEVFERSLIGGYSCVNTRLGFDTEVLLPNLTQAEYAKMNIDQSFQAYKNQNFKTGYKLKIGDVEKYKYYRITSKIIKFDESNQYGFAMTKPMAVGSIKDKAPSWAEFNLLMEKVTLDDPIGHLFLVHIEFDHEHATDAQIMYNEMMPPIIEKKATIEPNERSIFQLLELYAEDKKGMPKNYKVSPKGQATLLKKRNIPMYLEELKFVIYRCGWKVTKLCRHYYFEQERFKRDFILMNQKARQESKNKIESS